METEKIPQDARILQNEKNKFLREYMFQSTHLVNGKGHDIFFLFVPLLLVSVFLFFYVKNYEGLKECQSKPSSACPQFTCANPNPANNNSYAPTIHNNFGQST